MTFNTFLIPKQPNCQIFSKREANIVKKLITPCAARRYELFRSAILTISICAIESNKYSGVPTSKMIICIYMIICSRNLFVWYQNVDINAVIDCNASSLNMYGPLKVLYVLLTVYCTSCTKTFLNKCLIEIWWNILFTGYLCSYKT